MESLEDAAGGRKSIRVFGVENLSEASVRKLGPPFGGDMFTMQNRRRRGRERERERRKVGSRPGKCKIFSLSNVSGNISQKRKPKSHKHALPNMRIHVENLTV